MQASPLQFGRGVLHSLLEVVGQSVARRAVLRYHRLPWHFSTPPGTRSISSSTTFMTVTPWTYKASARAAWRPSSLPSLQFLAHRAAWRPSSLPLLQFLAHRVAWCPVVFAIVAVPCASGGLVSRRLNHRRSSLHLGMLGARRTRNRTSGCFALAVLAIAIRAAWDSSSLQSHFRLLGACRAAWRPSGCAAPVPSSTSAGSHRPLVAAASQPVATCGADIVAPPTG